MYENDTPDDGTTMRVGCQCSHEHADLEHEQDRPPNLTLSSASIWVKEGCGVVGDEDRGRFRVLPRPVDSGLGSRTSLMGAKGKERRSAQLR